MVPAGSRQSKRSLVLLLSWVSVIVLLGSASVSRDIGALAHKAVRRLQHRRTLLEQEFVSAATVRCSCYSQAPAMVRGGSGADRPARCRSSGSGGQPMVHLLLYTILAVATERLHAAAQEDSTWAAQNVEIPAEGCSKIRLGSGIEERASFTVLPNLRPVRPLHAFQRQHS